MASDTLLDRWSSGYGTTSADVIRRARRTAAAVLGGLLGYAIAIVVTLATGQALLAVPLGAALLALVLCGVSLRAGSSIHRVANAVVAVTATTLLGILAATGGASVGALIALPIVPVIAALIGGRRSLLVWSGITCSAIAAILGLEALGFSFPLSPDPSKVDIAKFPIAIIVVSVLCGITWVAENDRLRSEETASRAVSREEEVSQRLLEAQRRRLEEELERVRVLSAGVAHDFNNLLAVVLGNAELVREGLVGSSFGGELLDEIELAIDQAADLVDQLHAFAGDYRPVVRAVDASRLVTESVRLARSRVPGAVEIEVENGPDPLWLAGDASQIHRIVLNLILNAGEACEHGDGRVRIRFGSLIADRPYLSTCVLGGEAEPGPYAFLEVSDNGSGIDAESLARIFDPFFTTRFTGRGLGLAVVFGIVRTLDGAIHVESEPGQGSTFRVLLRQCAAPPSEERESSIPRELPSINALLVDDGSAVRQAARRILEGAGVCVLEASDGRQAIKLFDDRREDIDVVLLDLQMPDLDGEATFRELRKRRPTVPVVFVSGGDEEVVAAAARGAPRVERLRKPFRKADLEQAIARAMRDHEPEG